MTRNARSRAGESGVARSPQKTSDSFCRCTPKQLALIKGASFQMGDVWGDGNFAMGETPVHEVEVADFLLARREVTVAEFRRFVTATGYRTQAETDEEHPAILPGQVREGKAVRRLLANAGWFAY